MRVLHLSRVCLLVMLLFVTGCAGQIEPLTEPQSAPIQATAEIQATPTPIETHVNADWTNVQSRTEDGLAMLGNPNAPVTFVDYSDFM